MVKNTLKNFAVGVAIGMVALIPMLPVANAQVPTPSDLATQVASTTATASGYVTSTIFNGNLLQYLFYLALISVVIWLVIKGLRHIV